MTDRVSWIEHKGKKILYVDYSNATAEETLPAIESQKSLIMTQDKHSVLNLINVTNTGYNKQSWSEMRQAAKDTGRNTKAVAMIGVVDLKKFFFKVVKMVTKGGDKIRDFNNIEEAKDWLVSLK